jgi:hypothetical protein
MRLRVRDSRVLVVLSAALLGAAIAFPLGVLANHQFTDVPTSNTFHDDIDAIADAGVTTGCAAGKYCPKDFVTREQMAAFLNRLGALAPGKTPVVNATRLDGLDAAQFARTDVVRSGQTTCAGSAMLPGQSTYAYATTFNELYFTTASGHARCQMHLPDGATITAFKVTLNDASITESASCSLYRHRRTMINAQTVASEVSSGMDEDQGLIQLESDTIVQPTVDNTLYVYESLCQTAGFGSDVGIVGVTAEYTVTGVPLE